MPPRASLVVGLAIVAGCTGSAEPPRPSPAPAAAPAGAASAASAATPAPRTAAAPKMRATVDGRDFPDHVLALTWDDGPDVHTLELAEMLRERRVSATFFVVSEWIEGVSSDPGEGRGVLESGHTYLPLLDDLVALGHRLGNHTLHHVLLGDAPPEVVRRELGGNQRAIDPFLTNELRLFRVPGGWWTASASAAIADDPLLVDAIGPIRWDIDRKDWEGSLYCRGAPRECEPAAPGHHDRVRASVTAQRYLESIEKIGHGIVLMHDRVGHVGSTYAMDVASIVIPELEARGFVFAAPVLRFSPLAPRLRPAGVAWPPGPLLAGDLDGDGRADVCARTSRSAVACALSAVAPQAERGDLVPRTALLAGAVPPVELARAGVTASSTVQLADVDGDGAADLCVRGSAGIECATAEEGATGPFQAWSAIASDGAIDFSDAQRFRSPEDAGTLRFGDVDGDGRADACTLARAEPSATATSATSAMRPSDPSDPTRPARSRATVWCARSLGDRFERARPWAELDAAEPASMALGDVDGDGRADLCLRAAPALFCALSTGRAFARVGRWSVPADGPLASARGATLRLADLNGDGRADACALSPLQSGGAAVACALSTGAAFTRSTPWLTAPIDAFELADVNGDRRADLCARTDRDVSCALAP